MANENGVSSLKTLVFSFVVLNDGTLESALSKFPNLQTLKLLPSIFGNWEVAFKLKQCSIEKSQVGVNGELPFRWASGDQFSKPGDLVYKAGPGEIASFHFGGRGLENIKTLSVNGFLGWRDKSLEESISSCVLLENLYLNSCAIPEGHLEIYSSAFKTLVVHGCDHLQFAEIQALLLVYFQYVGQLENFLTLIKFCTLRS